MRFLAPLLALSILYPDGSEAQVPELAEPAVPDSVESEILGFISSYYDAFSNRDWTGFSAHFWPKATLTTVWQAPGDSAARVMVSTVDEFVAQAPDGPGSREIFEERMIAARVDSSGDIATVWTRYRARFGDPGEVMEWEGTDVFTLMRHRGVWRIVSLAFAAD